MINIITKDNGVGLKADYLILKSLLPDTNFIDVHSGKGSRRADVNIFLELVNPKLFELASVNYFIPNPEWYPAGDVKYLSYFDAIFAKTYNTERIMSKYHSNVIYIGWTSQDRRKESDKYRSFIHVAGKSSAKGTDEAWYAYQEVEYPRYFLKIQDFSRYNKNYKNCIKHFGVQSESKLIDLMNRCMFHVCPSKEEGFGHYINEALSTGAIVITTDAPPMNELITSEYGILVPYKSTSVHNLSISYHVDPIKLKDAMSYVYGLSDENIIRMSELSRESYEKRDIEFKNKIKSIFL